MNETTPKTKYHDIPKGVQRTSVISAHADGSEEKIVFRSLTAEQLTELDKELAETAVALKNHEEVLDLAKAKYKQDTVQLKENYKQLVQKIRARGEEINTTVHKFYNHVEMTVENYDGDGVFIDSRAMLPSEKNQFITGQTEPLVRSLNEGTNG